MNNVENLSFSPYPASDEIAQKKQIQDSLERFREFKRVIKIFLMLITAEIIEVRVDRGDPTIHDLVVTENVAPEYQPLLDEMRSTLGLDPGRNSFRITSRATGLQPNEISIQTRSLLAIMGFLSKGVDVPGEHLTEGRVHPTLKELQDPQERVIPIHIQTSRAPPEAAYVAVQYRGHWFYVDDSDLLSKRAFLLLMFLFELLAPSGDGAAPLLTLPTG